MEITKNSKHRQRNINLYFHDYVTFSQVKDEPWTDTTVMIEYLVHADGAQLNNSADHRWAIHEFPPGKDFYDWQNRCISAGDVFNPYKVSLFIKVICH